MTDYVLEILDGDRAGETIPLGDERVTLGRKPSNTISLHDEKVSGQHAEIVLQDGRYVLRDLESRNGTLLDGRKVEEIVLSSFDTFQIGRLRVQFREKGAEGLAMHRIDEDRLSGSRSRRGVLGLLVAVVLLAGAGAFYTFGLQPSADGGGVGRGRATATIVRVAGNKLLAGIDDCEDVDGWELGVSGAGFELGGPAHTGASALYALRADEAGEAAAEHALARTAEPLRVTAGEQLRLRGFVRTADGGRGALRVRFSSSAEDDDAPEPMWTGSAPVASDDEYTEVSLDVAVPPRRDRVEVEVLALLPRDGAEVVVDDLALTAGGEAAAIDLGVAATSLVGTGTGLALRIGEEPLIEHFAPGAAAGLGELSALSDAGCQVSAAAAEDRYRLQLSGAPATVQLWLPLSAAGGLRTLEADGVFRAQSGDFSHDGTAQLLLGGAGGRVLVAFQEPHRVAGRRAGDRFVLALEGVAALDLVVSFDAERTAAQTALREAGEAVGAGEPGRALDLLRDLVDRTPHDAELTGRAQRERGELRAALVRRMEELRAEYREAEFFRTRGAYVRLRTELEQLIAGYGEHNMPSLDEGKALRERFEQQLAELDAERSARAKQDLNALAAVFQLTGEGSLEQLVKTYIDKHLSN